MSQGQRFRGLPLLGVAMAGLALGHVATYVIAVPDAHHRDLVLQASGHAYLPVLAQLALVTAVAAAVTIVARAGAGQRMPGAFGALAPIMICVQVVGFVGQELLERVMTGAPLGDLRSGRVLLVGVIVQALVALLGSAVATMLARASDRLADADGPHAIPPWWPDALLRQSAEAAARRRIGAIVAHPGRAPPSI